MVNISKSQSSKSQTATKASGILILSFVFNSTLNYLFNLILGWLLTPETYGIWGVSVSFINLLIPFTIMTFPWIVSKLIAESSNKNDTTILGQTTTALIINTLLSGIIAIAFLLASFVFRESINLGNSFTTIILLIIAIIFTVGIRGIFNGIMMGLLKFTQLAITQITENFSKLLIAILLITLGHSVLGSLYAYFIGVFIALILAILFTKNFRFWKHLQKPSKYLLGNSWNIFWGMFLITGMTNIDILFLKFITPDNVSNIQAGYYQAALVISRIPFFLAGTTIQALFPYITQSKNTTKINYSNKTLKYSLIFLIPIAILVSTKASMLISTIFPNNYSVGGESMKFLGIAMGAMALNMVFTRIFHGWNRPFIPLIVLLCGILVQIPLLLLLIPTSELKGAAFATLIGCSTSFILFLLCYIKIIIKNQNYKSFIYIGILLFIFFGVNFLTTTNILVLQIIFTILYCFIYIFLLFLIKILQASDIESVVQLINQMPIPTSLKKKIEYINNKIIRLINTVNNLLG